MALTNSQYNELMRRYSRIRFQHQHEMEERLRHIYAQCPRLLEISKLLPTSSAALAKAKITGNKAQALNAQMQIDALRRERGALLSSLHYTLDDLQPKYSCPDCKDTGYLDGNRKCHCFEQAGISLLYEQSGIRDRLERDLAVFFIADGVFQLLSGQKPDAVLARDYIATFKLLGLYDIEQCWVCAASLRERGLDPQTPFVVEATPLEADALRRELANYDVILRF